MVKKIEVGGVYLYGNYSLDICTSIEGNVAEFQTYVFEIEEWTVSMDGVSSPRGYRLAPKLLRILYGV